MSVEAPKPVEPPVTTPLQRFLSPVLSIWDRFRRVPEHPVVGLLSPEQIQTQGGTLIKTGISIVALTLEIIKARNSARLQARNYDNDPERTVNIEATDVLIGSLSFSSIRVIETQEAQGRTPLALRMIINGKDPSVPLLKINVDLRSSDYQKPEIAYEDNRPGGQSQHPNTTEADASISVFFEVLKPKLSAPESVVPAQN